ncbi:MarR family winged helix-turn-helix transcriptional regulator [Streptomyces sp. NPDC102473]|uniref:MarR family winged helix-turn-helix transcriptional regulator n=1 Tax=Streptomyces sp. NPDC102473 TaxID=3366180 RepID=UPI00380A6CF3
MSEAEEGTGDPDVEGGLATDDAVRAMLLTMPRLVSRAKRTTVPEQLRSLRLAPRHLSLLSCPLFGGPTPVKDLAARLEVAPTTVSLMVSDLQRQGVVERSTDPIDRRRSIVTISEDLTTRRAVDAWLASSARAWHLVLDGLSPQERATVVSVIHGYEAALAGPPEAETADGADG